MLERRLNPTMQEVAILPTAECQGGCKFCFLNRSVVGAQDWENLFKHVIEFFSSRDFDERSNVVRLFGGELFMDSLVKDESYRKNILRLIQGVQRFIGGNGCVDMPISLENVSDLGIEFAQYLRDHHQVNLQVPFSTLRIMTPEKKKLYFENLAKIGKISRIAVLVADEKMQHEEYLEQLGQYARIDWEEPVMFDGFSYSYKNMRIPEMHLGVRCVANTLRVITPKGVFTCAGFTRRPSWIEDEEWNRLAYDEEYLNYGYQQVIDWYGCDTCAEQETCPGMCWKTYYAQRYVYKNRQCLYKSEDKL